jgi:hypothetical protein
MEIDSLYEFDNENIIDNYLTQNYPLIMKGRLWMQARETAAV